MTTHPMQGTEFLNSPPPGFRLFEKRVSIGSGSDRWNFAGREVLVWGIKVRSGFTVESIVDSPDPGVGSRRPVAVGDSARLVLWLGPIRVREPVRVLQVIDEPNRRGFAYGTLPGHQLLGEELFVVERDETGVVWLTVRTVSRPARGWEWALPLIVLGQRIVRARYLKALSGPIG